MIESEIVESAKAEERMLNMDFVTAKARELSNSRERAEVYSTVVLRLFSGTDAIYLFIYVYLYIHTLRVLNL